jgi:transglutaminase-like putative cysteine protease
MSVFRIIHITKYEYDKPVHESVNEIRIFPYLSPELEVLQHELIISHHPDVHVFKDYWGNKAGLFSIVEPHLRLAIESRLLIRLNYEVPGTGFRETTWQPLTAEIKNKLQHLELTRPELIEKQDQIQEICNQIFDPQKSVASIVQECNKYIYENFTYSKGITTIETTIDEEIFTIFALIRAKDFPPKISLGASAGGNIPQNSINKNFIWLLIIILMVLLYYIYNRQKYKKK